VSNLFAVVARHRCRDGRYTSIYLVSNALEDVDSDVLELVAAYMDIDGFAPSYDDAFEDMAFNVYKGCVLEHVERISLPKELVERILEAVDNARRGVFDRKKLVSLGRELESYIRSRTRRAEAA